MERDRILAVLIAALLCAACTHRSEPATENKPVTRAKSSSEQEPMGPAEVPEPRRYFPYRREEAQILRALTPSDLWFDPAIVDRPVASGYSRDLKVLLLAEAMTNTLRVVNRLLQCDRGLLYHGYVFESQLEAPQPISLVNAVARIEWPFAVIGGNLVVKKSEWLEQRYDVVVATSFDPANENYLQDCWDWIEAFVAEGGGLILIVGGHQPSLQQDNEDFMALFPFKPSEASETSGFQTCRYFGLTQAGMRHEVFNLAPSESGDAELWGSGGENGYQRGRVNGIYAWEQVGEPKDGCQILARAVAEGEAIESAPPLVATIDYGKGRVLAVLTDEQWLWREYVGDEHLGPFVQNAIRWAANDPGK